MCYGAIANFSCKLVFGVITKLAAILTGSKYQLTGRKRDLVSLIIMTKKLFIICFS